MEKSIIVFKIVLLIVLIDILIGLLVLFVNKDFNFNFGSKTTLIYNKNIEEDFNRIDVYSKNLDVKFVKSTDDTVNVKVYDNKNNNITVKVENNTLKVVSDNKISYLFWFVEKRGIVITLPERIYDLVVESKAGDITSELDFNKVTLKCTSGDVKFNNVKEADFNVTSGDVEINDADDLKVGLTSGDLEINKVNKHLDIESVSGDIDINDLKLTMNSNINAISGDVTIYKASDNIYYNTSVLSGDVDINNNNRHADIELKINTKSGDITVEN